MSKLMEKNGAEMAVALVSIAAPLKRFAEDEEFTRIFKQATTKGVKMQLTDIAEIYADVIPYMLGEAHVKDTMTILGVIEDKSVKELLKMNGVEMLQDVITAFKEQIKPFFTQLGLSAGVKQ